MDDKCSKLAKCMVAPHHVDSATDAVHKLDSILRSILAQRRLWDCGLDDAAIERILLSLSVMDSNNFQGHCGAGEREGRVLSGIVRRRHFYMSHGIGRSGDLLADQPKACGSSILYKVANFMTLDAVRQCGFSQCPDALIVPLATGMTLNLVMQSVRRSRPATAKYVVWPRIDQKTSLKCIEAAGLVPHCVELERLDVSFFGVSPAAVAAAVEALGPENVVCVLCTTSCFAPRVPDDPLRIGRAIKPLSVPMVVNNAYGMQSNWIMKRLDASFQDQSCSIDAVVQSTDKNFLVPVGGAVVCGRREFVRAVSELYAGRACVSQAMDMFVTLLHLGRDGLARLHEQRRMLFPYLVELLQRFADARGESVLIHEHNEVSLAVTMATVVDPVAVGAKLFRHGVSGPRVVTLTERKNICGLEFSAYGSHSNEVERRCPLLVVACSIGMTRHEADVLISRLEASWP